MISDSPCAIGKPDFNDAIKEINLMAIRYAYIIQTTSLLLPGFII